MAARTPNAEAVSIGRILRDARDRRLMSQTDLVNECRKYPETAKLAVETISRAERGLHTPRRRALRVFSKVLDIPFDTFRLPPEPEDFIVGNQNQDESAPVADHVFVTDEVANGIVDNSTVVDTVEDGDSSVSQSDRPSDEMVAVA